MVWMQVYHHTIWMKYNESLLHTWVSLCRYLRNWRLKLSTTKTVSLIFHLGNHMANYQLKVQLRPGCPQFRSKSHTYIGVKVDCSLTYKSHLTKLKEKVSSRGALVSALPVPTWGASFLTLRTSSMALAFSAAEYCAPVWTQSTHSCGLDVPLHDAWWD